MPLYDKMNSKYKRQPDLAPVPEGMREFGDAALRTNDILSSPATQEGATAPVSPPPSEESMSPTEIGKEPPKGKPDADNGSDINAESFQPESSIPGSDNLAKALKEYNTTVNQAMAAYKKERNTLKQRQMWEGIIQGVATIAAGLHGLHTGQDMSGLDLKPSDWASQIQAAQSDLKTQMASAGQKYRIKKDVSQDEFMRNKELWNRAYSVAKEEQRIAEAGERLGISREGLNIRKQSTASKERDKFVKAFNTSEKEIESILKNSKLDKNEKKSSIKNIIRRIARENGKQLDNTQLKSQVDQLFEEDPGAWIFDGSRNLAEQLDYIQNALAGVLVGQGAQQEAPTEDRVRMEGPGGDVQLVPKENESIFTQNGYKRI